MPHTGKDLYMIYSLRARNELRANRFEGYLQDNWNFRTGNDSVPTLYTLNYGVRFAHWNSMVRRSSHPASRSTSSRDGIATWPSV